MIFPVIRYHLEHGCESFGNQEDLDWALAHGWSRIPPKGYDKGFEPSKQTFAAVMKKLKGSEAEDDPGEPSETKKYISQMNVSELQQECKERGLDFEGLTKALMRKKIRKYDNSANTNNRLLGGPGAS